MRFFCFYGILKDGGVPLRVFPRGTEKDREIQGGLNEERT